MPIGIQRLNAKRSQPNTSIVFIKPLKGPDEKTAQDFLERIAAQCLPVMREHGLSVMSLEEYEPNREFVGRNFNAGEVIQLVLKSPRSGRWLPFEYVQMVMMHELAHCRQMNHSRAFWAVRNQFAAQMHGLWAKGYTGDGIWGRGARLATGAWEKDTVRPDEVLPEHLCGGTYRSRRRKRKVAPTLSYQERKERRILKKFGKNGMALGADDEAKVKLEKGKKVQAKPRVAGSARGRELRAAAALARFDKPKDEKVDLKDENETESGAESDYEDGDVYDMDSKDAVDLNGARITDGKGRGMVKVCEDEDADDPGAKNELDELQDIFTRIKKESPEPTLAAMPRTDRPETTRKEVGRPSTGRSPKRLIKDEPVDSPEPDVPPATPITKTYQRRIHHVAHPQNDRTTEPAPTSPVAPPSQYLHDKCICTVCSYHNPLLAVTCAMCANVLDRTGNLQAWQCDSDSCRDSVYLNSADCGLCGLCGRQRGSLT